MVRTPPATTRGFSLVELMVVVALVAIGAGIAIPLSTAMVSSARADGTSREVVSWLENARNRALVERRNFRVAFDITNNRLTISRVEINGATTAVLDRALPDRMVFTLGGMPDTPDKFGNSAAVDFDGPSPHMFASDGSFIDAAGDVSNGTIFLGRGSEVEVGRAITVFGATGLIRSWKRSGPAWSE